MTLQKTIHNALTGEITTRDYTPAELQEYETERDEIIKSADTKAKVEQANINKRQTILDRLGITADELQTLLG